MGRPGVDYSSVRDTIEEHREQHGTLPSIAVIIAEVGGSATTISKFKRRWLDESEMHLESSAEAQPPDAVLRGLHQGARAVWKEMAEALGAQERDLEERFAEKTDVAEMAIKDAQASERSANQESERLQKQLGDTSQALDGVTQQYESTRTSLQQASNGNTQLTTQLDAARQQLDELRETHTQALANANDRLLDVKAAATATAETAVETARTTADVRDQEYQQRVQQLEEEVRSTGEELAATQKSLQTQTADYASLQAEHRAATKIIKEQAARLKKGEADAATVSARADKAELKWESVQNALATTKDRLSEAAVNTAEHLTTLKHRERELKELTRQHESAIADKDKQIDRQVVANEQLRQVLGELKAR